MFITFQDLTSFALIGIVLTLAYALLGAVPFTIPMMIVILLVASIFCGRMT
jgi:uncharacterized membrane protein